MPSEPSGVSAVGHIPGGGIYLIVSFVRGPQSTQQDKREEPIELAKRRYASGQITRDEYERIRHDLAA
jgi:uncharacterized membrane protein